ncbi:MAG: methyltransferase domain-containing protein [Ignavibacteriales bacterium]|nr:methyltransferase domain-containing protein [Ignavibacteriales bacterium]
MRTELTGDTATMHKFSPGRSEKLENPDRYQFLPPAKTLVTLGLKRGMTMADIGAGTGFFARAASEIVGSQGRVYAVDMSAEMLDQLKQRGLPPNVTPVLSKEYTIPLEDHSVDFSFLAFVVHETERTSHFLEEVKRITRKGGRVAIVEWKKQVEEHGPPEEERIGREELIERLSDFPIAASGNLNSSHYFVLLQI